ncbi:MarR family winged helix-turn-helix transcriptional regulator [Celeribacter indicus]|uniref:Transcriptional regulator n=1 Tax=Celeribacter indicus TaxID=1208324 RepID=A0A0B5DZK0_9RHOB|nr:MarR family transcriptional regulator [Celeribacter indicus]AJE46121.1 Transcriptional regulator [Celeribacter indicus]SDX37510.1 transcriptional regulator, MarR family [Celeribacter indicus]
MLYANPNTEFVRKFTTANRKLRVLFDARTGEYGLTQARARVLLLLARNAPMTQAELADALDVERPTMARLIDAMEGSGLLRRETCFEDRRQRNISLTEAAEGEAQAVLTLTSRLSDDVLAGISEADLAVLDRVLSRMLENIEGAGPK